MVFSEKGEKSHQQDQYFSIYAVARINGIIEKHEMHFE